ncbi:MAG: DUF4003 domain-containing protein [Lachnospiraceae bacterium]|nr:DUF4003 domain-containing protein [Lachnospiraceae bacterium]
MDTRITERCDLIEENYLLLSKMFMAVPDMLTLIVAADSFADRGKTPDKEKMEECKKILKKNTGLFSAFRGEAEVTLLSKMAMSEDPEAYFKDVVEAYDNLKKASSVNESERVIAAIMICGMNKVKEAGALGEKASEIINFLKKNHRFVAHEFEYGYIILLALSDRKVEDIADSVERNYHTLVDKLGFHNGSVYRLALVLEARGKNSTEDCERIGIIYRAMLDNGVKYDKELELPSLGLLAGLGMNENEIAMHINDIEEYTKNKKGFKSVGNGKASRYMIAVMLLAKLFASDSDTEGIEDHITITLVEEIMLMLALINICIICSII